MSELMNSEMFRLALALVFGAIVWTVTSWKKLQADWKTELKILIIPVMAAAGGMLALSGDDMSLVFTKVAESLLIAFGVVSAVKARPDQSGPEQ